MNFFSVFQFATCQVPRQGTDTWRAMREFIKQLTVTIIIYHTREIQRLTLIPHQDRFLPYPTISELIRDAVSSPSSFLVANKRDRFVAYLRQQLLRPDQWRFRRKHRTPIAAVAEVAGIERWSFELD